MADTKTEKFDAGKANIYLSSVQAMGYVKSGSAHKAMGALKHLNKLGGASDVADNLLKVVGANFTNIKNASQLYVNDFSDIISYANGEDLKGFYSTVLGDLSDEDKETFEAVLGTAKTPLKEIQNELTTAEYVLSGAKEFSEIEKQNALETQAKYEKFNQVQDTLLDFKAEETAPDSIREAKTLTLEQMAKGFRKKAA